MTVETFTPTDDCLINGNLGVRNYGASTTTVVEIGGSKLKLLLKFGLSGIAAGNVCSAAALTLIKTSAAGANYPVTYTLFEIASGNAGWIEGTKNNITAGAGECCWNALAADGASGVTTAWAGSAGLATAGTDYVNTALGTIDTNKMDAQYTAYTFTLNASGLAVIENWFGSDDENYGLLITAPAAGIVAGMSENTTEAYRPVLSVTYSAGGALLKVNFNAQMQNMAGGF